MAGSVFLDGAGGHLEVAHDIGHPDPFGFLGKVGECGKKPVLTIMTRARHGALVPRLVAGIR